MIRKRKKTHTMYNKGLFDDTNGTGYNRKMKRKRTPAERGAAQRAAQQRSGYQAPGAIRTGGSCRGIPGEPGRGGSLYQVNRQRSGTSAARQRAFLFTGTGAAAAAERKGGFQMEKARKLTSAEIALLSWGAVVWRESHTVFSCGRFGQIDGYNVYPMLITEPGIDGVIGYTDRENEAIVEIKNLPETDNFWSLEPEPEQIEKGIPIDEALEMYNKYEAEKLAM